jgi:hypothetical protein
VYKIQLKGDWRSIPGSVHWRIRRAGRHGGIVDIPDVVLNYHKNHADWCVVLEHYKYKVSFVTCKHCLVKRKVRTKVAFCRCGKLDCKHY